MPVKDQAAYMREYRAQRKRRLEAPVTPVEALDEMARRLKERAERIEELEAEVARLKRELAARPDAAVWEAAATQLAQRDPSFVQFNPAPKPGRK